MLLKGNSDYGNLTADLIKNHNPHFGSVVRIVEPVTPHKSANFDFTHYITVGARGSDLGFGNTGDAWATYLWSPSKKAWVLGAN